MLLDVETSMKVSKLQDFRIFVRAEYWAASRDPGYPLRGSGRRRVTNDPRLASTSLDGMRYNDRDGTPSSRNRRVILLISKTWLAAAALLPGALLLASAHNAPKSTPPKVDFTR